MRLSLELQSTRRRIAQGNLSTFHVSWDMRHDLKPRPEATICFTKPINETVGAPALYQAFSLQIFTNLNLFFPIANLAPKTNGGEQQQASRRQQGRWEPCQFESEAMIAIFSLLLA
jgi:hypothetical protein